MASAMTGINTVVVHPLVLLSVVDHYNRVAKDTKKRVVGVLLGETNKGVVDVTNSYAGKPRPQSRFLPIFLLILSLIGHQWSPVPFEEDPRNPKIWFVDHNYHENMFSMFKKVNGASTPFFGQSCSICLF